MFNKFVGKISKLKEKAKKEENKIVRENLKYSQSITYTGSWTHDLIKDRIFFVQRGIPSIRHLPSRIRW